MAGTIQQAILGCDRDQSTDDCLRARVDRVRNARGVGGVVCFDDNLSMPHDQQAVENSLLSVRPGKLSFCSAPKSTSLASSFESMPCSSGEDTCHSFVGQIGSAVPWASAAQLQIEAADMNAPSATARKPNLSLRELFG
jgi:hypothetical protein